MPQTITVLDTSDGENITGNISFVNDRVTKLEARVKLLEAPPPIPNNSSNRMYAALYGWPVKYVNGTRVLSDQWQAFHDAARDNPNCFMVAAFNPDNGNFGLGRNLLTDAQIAAATANPDMYWALEQLDKLGNVSLIGYVAMAYGIREIAIIKQRMALYKKLYPQVREGFFLDEMPNTDIIYVQKCKDITTYAKELLGASAITVGNPGTATRKEFVGTMSIILIFEGTMLPTEPMLRDRTLGMPKENFGVIPWGISIYDRAWVQMAKKYCHLIEMTNDGQNGDTNGWDGASIYWNTLAKDIVAP